MYIESALILLTAYFRCLLKILSIDGIVREHLRLAGSPNQAPFSKHSNTIDENLRNCSACTSILIQLDHSADIYARRHTLLSA